MSRVVLAFLRRWFAGRLLARFLPGGWLILALSSPWARRLLMRAVRRLRRR
ncbi:MAG: hypothetical protein H0V03_05035 [Thermoleophilaceae bacterium]|nr:hypothetical protein [Thermoleophilaceae bacterium]